MSNLTLPTITEEQIKSKEDVQSFNNHVSKFNPTKQPLNQCGPWGWALLTAFMSGRNSND